MKICQYNNHQAGAVVGDKVYPIGDALVKAGHVRAGYTMQEVIDVLSNKPGAMDSIREVEKTGAPLPLSGVKLLAPILNPPTIWAAAANYKAHQAEMIGRVKSADRSDATKEDLMAEFFMKPNASLIGPGGPVVLPRVSKHVDFECELCAVIGKPGKHISAENALSHVFGYTILWDFSQRDPWGIGKQNTRNIRKGFDTFTGLGPWIVTADEIPDPHDIHFTVEQNGNVVMKAHTKDMICNLFDHIPFLSACVTLTPGTLISTGTPAGVSRLAHGDKLKGTMDRIGSMEVDVVAEK
jgi:2-keto-4-pentenoate hydratase/2-oxohepta-3-ene-1,7-dioic acid hydratase in catechol pathway